MVTLVRDRSTTFAALALWNAFMGAAWGATEINLCRHLVAEELISVSQAERNTRLDPGFNELFQPIPNEFIIEAYCPGPKTFAACDAEMRGIFEKAGLTLVTPSSGTPVHDLYFYRVRMPAGVTGLTVGAVCDTLMPKSETVFGIHIFKRHEFMRYQAAFLAATARDKIVAALGQPAKAGDELVLHFGPMATNERGIAFTQWLADSGLDIEIDRSTGYLAASDGEYDHTEGFVYDDKRGVYYQGKLTKDLGTTNGTMVENIFRNWPEVFQIGRMTTRRLFDRLAFDGLVPTQGPRPLWVTPPTKPEEAGKILAAISADSSTELFQTAVKESGGKNVILSPYGAETALLAAAVGAAGRTQAEMLDQMHLLWVRLDDVLAARKAQQKAWERLTADEDKFYLGSRIFVNNAGRQFHLEPAYAGRVEEFLGVQPVAFDFSDGKAVEKNAGFFGKWGDRKVAVPVGQIPHERVILANYLKLQGLWQQEFDAAGKKPFHLDSGDKVDVPMLDLTGDLRFLAEREFRATTLPLEYSPVTVDIIAPRPGVNVDTLVAQLDGRRYRALAERLDNVGYPLEKVHLVIPEVKEMKLTVNLRALYEKQGLTAPFGGTAQFRPMAAEPLRIDRFEQDLEWSFAKDGTSIAALTTMRMPSLGMYDKQKPPVVNEMVVDRTYLVVYREKVTGQILFMLRVVDPRG